MRVLGVVFFAVLACGLAKNCPSKKSNSKLFCYYSKITDIGDCYCTHAILPANSDVKAIERAREQLKGVKILVTVSEFNQGLVDLLKNSKVDGLEINLKKLDSKNDINDFISTVRSKLGSNLYLALSVPSKADILAKYFDFKSLSKQADLFILQTAFLGASKNVTFHPSRLSGLWDMQNTDSVVDLVTGLGAPVSKLVITAPVQAFHFTLQDEAYTAPGSPALEVKSLTRNQLCSVMNGGANWTLERDEDQAGPYIFSKDQWIAFEDSTSMDIKAKYSRVRGLAGLALKDVSQDGGDQCGSSILESAYNGLSRQARAPRGAVLHSLEREIVETARPLDKVQVSPYRISRIIDVEGKVHVIRQDTRTEFVCSRQGYFVHPRSCNRFYRCVKFDQLTDEFSVFEFDCPAGLAFDERVEVCVWPGSLQHGTPCSGSSEIAPVPKERFICPTEPGYYADPENCRWFFACLDHGKSPLSAYEFRCPFGLVFDSERLLCEWSWLVPKCASGGALGVNLASEFVYGGYPSAQGTGIVLEQYDGLGALGAVKLGGIAGKVVQPIVYSNVGGAGLGYQNTGYINQGGYIIGNGLVGLNAKAAQSLQNAGLLSGNLGVGTSQVYHGNEDNGIQYSIGTAGLGSGLNSAAHLSNLHLESESGAKSDAVGALDLSHVRLSDGADAASLNLAGGAYGTKIAHGIGLDTTNLNLQHATGANTGQYQFNVGGDFGAKTAQGVLDTTNVNLQHAAGADAGQYQINVGSNLGYNADGDFGTKTAQGVLQYQGLGEANNAPQEGLTFVQHQANGGNLDYNIDNAFGAKTSQIALNSVGLDQQGLKAGQGNFGLNLNAVNANGAKSSQSFIQYHGQAGHESTDYDSNLGANLDAASVFGAKSTQGLTQYHDHSGQANIDNSALNQHEISKENLGANIEYNVGSVNGFGVKLVPQGFIQHQGPIDQIAVDNIGLNQGGQNIHYQANLGSTLDYDAAKDNSFGAKSSQSFTQYHDGSDYQEGVSGNINIVGGGYSAVGASKSGVEIQNNGVNIDAVIHTTPSPIAITTFASVPTVTSVPIPALKTAAGFERYKGGVIANVPELQYKVYGNTAVANTSANLVKFVSTTPSTLLINEGYQYKKPAVAFVEQGQYQNEGKAQSNAGGGATSYSYQSLDTSVNNGGYVYSKPTIAFEEGEENVLNQAGPIHSYIGSSTVRPNVDVVEQNVVVPVQKSEGYVYSRPNIAFEETPIKTVSSFSISTPTVTPIPIVHEKIQSVIPLQPVVPIKSAVSVQPIAAVQPVASVQPIVPIKSTVVPIQPTVSVQSTVPVQPAVASYTFHRQDQSFGKQPVIFGERQQPQVAISTYNEVSTPQPTIIEQRPQVIISSTVAPIAEQNVAQLPVSSYNVVQHFSPRPFAVSEEKPTVQAIQTPAVVSQFSIRPAVQPTVATLQEVQPAVVASYNIQQPTVIPNTIVQPTIATYEQEFQGYQYSKPAVAFEEKPALVNSYNYQQQPVQPAVTSYTYQDIAQKAVAVQPAVVSSYNYVSPSTPKPDIFVQNQPVVSTYITPTTIKSAVLIQKQPAVVSSFSFTASTSKPEILAQQQNVEFEGYDYPKPAVAFEEQPTPVVTSYEDRQPVEEIPFVKKKAYITGQNIGTYSTPRTPVIVENYQAPNLANAVDTSSAYFVNNVNTVSSTPAYQQEYYSTPVYQEPASQVYVQTTPRPTYKSTVASVIAAKVQPVTEAPNFYYFDSRLSSTPQPVPGGYSYPKPQVVFEERRPIQPIVSTTYSPAVAPTREYLPAQAVTTSRPIYKYSFSSVNDQYQYVSTPSPVVVASTTPLVQEYIPVKSRVQVSTPEPVFVVPEISTVNYQPIRSKVRYSTTVRPVAIARENLPVRPRVSVTTSAPSTQYLPVTTTPVEVTTLSRDYLPVTVTGSPLEAYGNAEVGSRRPAKITIIKQNDFHPLLATKLGAQCTCLSSNLTPGKKKKIIIVEDDDDDDGYVVANNNEGGVVVENYQYNPQQIVDITPTPQIYLKSTTNEIVPAPTPTYVRQRVRARPITPAIAYQGVTETAELRDQSVSDAEVVSAVRTGLKLVKQAAREGAKEGTEEIISKYGPGVGNVNVRGAIECERAGLFRHPSQCNKFYACRWDCDKNKFTVHTFNCPIHLTFDSTLGACNWPSQGPACLENTLLPSE